MLLQLSVARVDVVLAGRTTTRPQPGKVVWQGLVQRGAIEVREQVLLGGRARTLAILAASARIGEKRQVGVGLPGRVSACRDRSLDDGHRDGIPPRIQ